MKYDYITTQHELTEFCRAIAETPLIAFDTEFVSEDSYRPELCLLQVAAAGRYAVIDALAVRDLAPFWELLVRPPHESVVHAGRQELCFCLQETGRRPHRLFDTQIAAGLVGTEYPAAYTTLVSKFLGKRLHKGETRTNWRRRPLSHHQLRYAVQDVAYLEAIREALFKRLQERERLAWMDAEMDRWQTGVERAEFLESWRRISGAANLPPETQAIVRALWQWREAEARRQDRPARRVLRDDLVVELARRGTADLDQIGVLRGMERRHYRQHFAAIAECIRAAQALPPEQWPQAVPGGPNRPQFGLLSQFLATALACVCREKQVASALVGSMQDLRDYVAFRLGTDEAGRGTPPPMATGWRAEIAGATLDDLLGGKTAIRIANPWSDQPLELDRIGD